MVTLVPMRFVDAPLLWTRDDVLSEPECRNLITTIEQANPGLATDNPMYRDQDRVIVDDAELAELLLKRLGPSLPEELGGLRVKAVNDRFRLYRYRVGQRFAPHMDHWYQPSPRRITLLTVLVYLNGGFEGGSTRFHEQLSDVVVPVPGRAAVFQHKVRHEGEPVEAGTKYALRTDILYEADDDIELTYAD